MFSPTHTLKMKFYAWCLIGEVGPCADIVHFKRVTSEVARTALEKKHQTPHSQAVRLGFYKRRFQMLNRLRHREKTPCA